MICIEAITICNGRRFNQTIQQNPQSWGNKVVDVLLDDFYLSVVETFNNRKIFHSGCALKN